MRYITCTYTITSTTAITTGAAGVVRLPLLLTNSITSATATAATCVVLHVASQSWFRCRVATFVLLIRTLFAYCRWRVLLTLGQMLSA